ncbi:SRPBCC family protein [Gordonia hydrophobica]|uniref:SRPBCC family protein n=1 Tax=Gordonia hydrophobica TaxID=40516 RepID=A0ABZ2TYR2_9ACTN|nr:SRPBCC family protein [Gordonia hydrophobica]MBM7367158.1 uncharacterized protein YndB with AHSA1/START domain [Gordonia hydrophobica]
MSTPTPTGRRRDTADGGTYCEWQRTFRAPVADVWAAVTEPERLARWLGTWTGDPSSGSVNFRMLYEGDDMPAEGFAIDECDPPTRLRITTSFPYDSDDPTHWHLRLDLTEADGVTTLTFAQSVPDPTMAEGVGPGWDYYLDRLVAAETGTDPATVDFADYHPNDEFTAHYRAEFGI